MQKDTPTTTIDAIPSHRALPTETLAAAVATYFNDATFRADLQADPAQAAESFLARSGQDASADSDFVRAFMQIPPSAIDASIRALAALLGVASDVSEQRSANPEPDKAGVVATVIAVGVINVGWAANVGTVVNVAGPYENPDNLNALTEKITVTEGVVTSDAGRLLTSLGLSAARQAALMKRAIADGLLDDEGRATYTFEDRELAVSFLRDTSGIQVLDLEIAGA